MMAGKCLVYFLPPEMNPVPARDIPINMLTKNDFTASEWATLRDTPSLVGFATLMAGASGLGTIKESMALAQGVIENQKSNFPLIRDLSSTAEMQASQGSMREKFGTPGSKPTPESMRQLALEQARQSISILSGKASAEETDAWRRTIYGLAEKVANAAREGGFLGFGGTLVSEGEQTFLDQLREALQLEQARRA